VIVDTAHKKKYVLRKELKDINKNVVLGFLDDFFGGKVISSQLES